MDVLVGQQRFRLDPRRAIGKGGEADVYDLGDGRAFKLFKSDQHADVRGLPAEEAAARARLLLHQRKLPAFPIGLPAAVIAPGALATAAGRKAGPGPGAIVGYAMPLVRDAEPLLRWGEPAFRRTGAPAAQAVEVFRRLQKALAGLHARGVVIGDFNDLNVLVRATPGGAAEPFLIDADSFQFDGFPCTVFTERFLDPRLCDRASGQALPVRPFDESSDWFAYCALLLQSLLLVGPWGGIHRPQDLSKMVPARRRMLERVSIFQPEVQLPKAAAPREALPDDLLHALVQVFERDERRPLPLPLLDALAFVTCASCGLEHARIGCPRCRPHAAARVSTVLASRGSVTAKTLFETEGTLLCAALSPGGLRVLHHLRDAGGGPGRFLRENGGVVLEGPLDPALRFGLVGAATAVARGGQLALLHPGSAPLQLGVDACGTGPAMAASGARLAWSSAGRLFAEDEVALFPSAAARGLRLGPEPLGEVLESSTRLFLGAPGCGGPGAEFGLGLSRAGELSLAFTFFPGRRGLCEQLSLPRLPGELLRARCAFGDGLAFLLLALRHRGRTLHRVLCLDREARLVADAEGEEDDGSWLGAFPELCAAGRLLFAATDGGLCRVELQAGKLALTRAFPDTEAFVDGQTRLLVGPEGLLAVGPRTVRQLSLGSKT